MLDVSFDGATAKRIDEDEFVFAFTAEHAISIYLGRREKHGLSHFEIER